MRELISMGQRLFVTLSYLVTGYAYVTIASGSYRISPANVGRRVKETCAVIWNYCVIKDM